MELKPVTGYTIFVVGTYQKFCVKKYLNENSPCGMRINAFIPFIFRHGANKKTLSKCLSNREEEVEGKKSPVESRQNGNCHSLDL